MFLSFNLPLFRNRGPEARIPLSISLDNHFKRWSGKLSVRIAPLKPSVVSRNLVKLLPRHRWIEFDRAFELHLRGTWAKFFQIWDLFNDGSWGDSHVAIQGSLRPGIKPNTSGELATAGRVPR